MNGQFVRKERDHLAAIQKRIDYLTSPEGREDAIQGCPGFFPGEANALAWALSIIEGTAEPIELRVERVEHRLRKLDARLGQMQRDLEGSD